MDITPKQWLIALLIAGLVHAAIAYALVQSTAPVQQAPSGITLELGTGEGSGSQGDGVDSSGPMLRPAPARGQSADTPMLSPTRGDRTRNLADSAEAVARPAPAPPEALVAKTVAQPRPAPHPTAVRPADGLPDRPRDKASKTTSKPSPPRSSAAAQEPAPDADREPHASESRASGQASAPPAASEPTPARRAREQRPRRVEAEPTSQRDHGGAEHSAGSTPREARSGAGTGRESSGGRGTARTGSASDGGGLNARNYYGRLATWLARHKRYPVQARRLGQEGTVKVTFTVSRTGRVLAQRVTQSSGHALLDREAQAMLDRASPLPRIPASLGRDSLTISLPVAFALR